MRHLALKLLTVTAAIGFTTASLAQNVVHLTYDPVKEEPTIVSNTQGSMVTFRSIDYIGQTNPKNFLVVFSNFVGEWDDTFPQRTPCFNDNPNPGEVLCVAQPTNQAGNPCQENIPPSGMHACFEVRVKLNNPATPASPGFRYRVIMDGTKVMDPRLRGN